jgi:hypothetical protein
MYIQVKSFHQEQSPEALGEGVTNYNFNAIKHMTTGLMVNIGKYNFYVYICICMYIYIYKELQHQCNAAHMTTGLTVNIGEILTLFIYINIPQSTEL